MENVEQRIKYKFQNQEYLRRALTHSSYANEHKKTDMKNNERLEFLGDSVLGLIISEYLYNNFNTHEEGQLTKMRAKIVCEASLGEASRKLRLGEAMMFGRGEELTGGRDRTSILSDAFEAVVAALFLDGGIEVARVFVLRELQDTIQRAAMGKLFTDYKTKLQEEIQIKKGNRIRYEIVKEEGPDHAKLFHTNVLLNEVIIGSGTGRSKKESEQEAAKAGLRKLTTHEK